MKIKSKNDFFNSGHGEGAKESDKRVVRKCQRRVRDVLSLGKREFLKDGSGQ